MSKMTIGLNLYTVHKHCKDAAGLRYTLARLKKIGYTAVQVSGVALPPEEIAAVLKDSGLTCAATHVPWPMVRDETARAIEIHQMYGCKHVAIGSLPEEYFQGVSGVDRFARELPEPAKKLAAVGMDFSYHNHDFEFTKVGAKTWLETLYERIAPTYLKAELDTYWVHSGGGDPAQWIRRMAGREPLLHVKDRRMTFAREPRFAEIGEGNLDWPGILQAAEESGVQYVLVEQDNCYDRDPLESVAISYRFLKSMGLK